ncbi:4-hydroxybenzoate polyprenyltransferase, mitochondrial (4-HB polyprenyltransferase) [Komagataella phaffii CBS 7435]|uniref:4-hydroxybenzoate polyprenyltransferase, mitochondrial n=2 Tax=Komagataella phaffii TaxID=460519 RepID=C4R445_KOMPG|nr:Para hydroxybenzoate: polyprenyl transferase [Komagataella phaffii GS115]AOA64108.1 GQ67_03346T0 [Komagataella phaffii]CAH2449924.1 4-hydroxybenzoate polyprenyltransferase, mitochondrial (4-HB polyprenyltransferase) [Komagataella phaffii CBS 7435]AOA68423.1 GQ68_03315T0 [Komagataella phaffii GS115]CAY70331.1 Para hydroxybenzoate: polyprenyl transferase [Komagataella phaffii GS115]CCA39878.1 4-hydroxybenzoate polyprenyltransferase, mitochondrial (4-HB polyprenyltransferase) [Komagataella pha
MNNHSRYLLLGRHRLGLKWLAQKSVNQKFRLISSSTKKLNTVVQETPIFDADKLAAARQARLDGLGVIGKLPEKWIPYAELMRLEKPIGSWLLYSPCTWSITMAAYSTTAPLSSTLWMLGVFGVGALIMRGAGCTINDLLDRDLDNKVERTIERPLASRRVTPKQAITFLGAQLAVGLGVLLQLPADCFLLGAVSLVPVAVYPLFKRITYYPQVVLSSCFTWGALLGFPAMGVWNWSSMIPLYLSSFAWCMTYDTIYAHQDKKFDVKAGIKSTALAWGDKSKPIMYGLTTIQMATFALSGYMNSMGPGFALGAIIGGYRVFQMVRKVDLDNPKDCWYHFRNNINNGHIFFAGIFLDYILRLLGYI